MKSYTITVNGNVYDVTVEEKGGVTPAAAPAPQAAPVMAQAPQAAPAPAAKSTGAGSVQVKAGAAGKVFKIEASVGQTVKRGDAVVIIEAMKIMNDIESPYDGVIASVDVTNGQTVEYGQLLYEIK